MQFRMLFWHILYYKVRQSNFTTKCERLLLQSASGITKCDKLLLQTVPGTTKCDNYYKVTRNNCTISILFSLKKAGWTHKINQHYLFSRNCNRIEVYNIFLILNYLHWKFFFSSMNFRFQLKFKGNGCSFRKILFFHNNLKTLICLTKQVVF